MILMLPSLCFPFEMDPFNISPQNNLQILAYSYSKVGSVLHMIIIIIIIIMLIITVMIYEFFSPLFFP
jgi:hypothetical protein